MGIVFSQISQAEQAYPNRIVKIIVPYPAGGTVDLVARVIAQNLSNQLGQSFIVDNRPGANGLIGSELVAKSQPDGYTLLVQASTFATYPALQKNLPFDIFKDFEPVSLFGNVPLVISAYPEISVNNLKEFIELVRKEPRKYVFAAPPIGSAGHLAEEAIKNQANLDLEIVPYKGTSPAMTDVMGGHATAIIDALPSSNPFIKSGRIKPLAVTSVNRISLYPNVPTAIESGLNDFNMVSWYGLLAPVNTPPLIVRQLSLEVKKAVNSKLVEERLKDQGFNAVGSNSVDFKKFIQSESEKYSQIVKSVHLKME